MSHMHAAYEINNKGVIHPTKVSGFVLQDKWLASRSLSYDLSGIFGKRALRA